MSKKLKTAQEFTKRAFLLRADNVDPEQWERLSSTIKLTFYATSGWIREAVELGLDGIELYEPV